MSGLSGLTPPVPGEIRRNPEKRCIFGNCSGNYLRNLNYLPPPSWLLAVETIDMKDADHARRIADQHREAVDALDNVHLRIAYLGGVLDAQFMAEGEQTWVD